MLKKGYRLQAFELEVALNSPMDRDILEYKTIMLAPVKEEPNVFNKDLPPPDASIYCPNTWSLIQKWFSNCKDNHSKCKPSKSSWYPTRLLDLQYEYNDDPVEQLAILNPDPIDAGWKPSRRRPSDRDRIHTANWSLHDIEPSVAHQPEWPISQSTDQLTYD
ncbi:hypothetical protein BDZ45DRAFT_676285 [Acephala macrosclerotiorum]|nr:hypothetical protein BDZ45DRAFT_676285 [Acephala macrosclerotiorum]